MSSSTYLLAGQASELERLQLPQPLGEQAARQARGAVGDLVEGSATQDDDVAQDNDGPALGKQF